MSSDDFQRQLSLNMNEMLAEMLNDINMTNGKKMNEEYNFQVIEIEIIDSFNYSTTTFTDPILHSIINIKESNIINHHF